MTDIAQRLADHLRMVLIKGRDNGHGSLVIILDRQTWKKTIALLAEHAEAKP